MFKWAYELSNEALKEKIATYRMAAFGLYILGLTVMLKFEPKDNLDLLLGGFLIMLIGVSIVFFVDKLISILDEKIKKTDKQQIVNPDK